MALGKLSTTGGVGQLPVVHEEPSDEARIEAVSSVVPTLDLNVEGKSVTALIDSGSCVSLLHEQTLLSTYGDVPLQAAPRLCAVNGEGLRVLGAVDIECCIGGCSFLHAFVVSPDIRRDMILGSDFLFDHGALLNIAQGTLTFKDLSVPLGVKATSFGPSEPSPAVAEDPAPVSDSCVSDSNSQEDLSTYSSRVTVGRALTLPAGHVVLVPCMSVQEAPVTVDCVADPLDSFLTKFPDVSVTPGVVTVGPDRSRVVVVLENHSDHPVLLAKDVNIAELSPVPEDFIVEDNDPTVSSVADTPPLVLSPERAEVIRTYVDSQSHLSVPEKSTLTELLRENHDLFILQEGDFGHCDVFPHRISTGETKPVKQPTRRVPYHRRQALQALLDDLLARGIITESISPWASPIVLVPKKDGSLRLCIDYRKLNSVTEPDAYPIPRVDDMLDSLSGCSWFTCLDLASGYWQIAMDEEDKAKTAFTTPLGLFEFSVMPMGCRNGPATFQRVMEAVLHGLCNVPTQPFCRVFFDDVLNASSTLPGQLQILKSVFDRVRAAGLMFNLKKCSFFQRKVLFLGHQVSADGLAPDPAKVEAIEQWAVPKSVRDVRVFLGYAGYYRRFIRGFAQRSAPLTALSGKNASFMWTKSCDAAFTSLKRSLTTAPVLAYPDFSVSSGGFILDTDASKVAIGAVLSQMQDGEERPIAFGSRVLTKAERNYDASDRETLALVHFANQFRHYLLGRNFIARTDNTALTALMSVKEPRGRKARWVEQLAEYTFTTVHRPGRQHLNADGLSRSLLPEVQPSHLETPANQPEQASSSATTASVDVATPVLAGLSAPELAASQAVDVDLSVVLSWYNAVSGKFVRPPEDFISGTSRTMRLFWANAEQLSLIDSVLYISPPFSDHDHVGTAPRLVVPFVLQRKALLAVHALPSCNHPGVDKTLAQARLRFFWFGMASDVQEFVACCVTCAQIRLKSDAQRAPLQPMYAGYPFQLVALDIVGPLPETPRGNRYLLVMADYFTRWAEAFPLQSVTAEAVAVAVVNGWIARFGSPEQLHSDQGPQFESKLFAELCRLLGIHKTRTTPYHPEGDGLVERLNRTLLGLLRAHITPTSIEWDATFSLVLLSYRSAVHASTGHSPAKLLYGTELRLPADVVFGLPQPASLESTSYVRHLQFALRVVHAQARELADLSHEHQEEHYNRRTKGAPLAVGQFVYVKDAVIHPGEHRKFHRPWRGPFRIVSVFGSTSYVVDVDGRHKTLHFNRLKLAYLPSPSASLPLEDPVPAAPVMPQYVPHALDSDHSPLSSTLPQSTRAHLARNAGLPARFTDFAMS